MSDFTMIVGDERIKVHRLVLMIGFAFSANHGEIDFNAFFFPFFVIVGSPVFKRMFRSIYAESVSENSNINHSDYDVVMNMLECLCTGKAK